MWFTFAIFAAILWGFNYALAEKILNSISPITLLALGGSCYALDKPEFGWVKVNKRGEHNLFGSFEQPIHVFQWHQFANHTAPDIEVLLENSQCVQAFRYHHNSIGLQFHLEVDTNLIQRWLEHPNYLEHLRRHLQPEAIDAIRAETQLHLPRSMTIANHFFANFCSLFNKKTYALSSRTAGRDLF